MMDRYEPQRSTGWTLSSCSAFLVLDPFCPSRLSGMDDNHVRTKNNRALWAHLLFQCFEIHTLTLEYKGNRCRSPEFPRRPGNDEHHKPESSRTECLGHKHPLNHVAVIHMIIHKVQPSYDGGQFSVLQQAQICGCRSSTAQTRFPLSGCLTYLTSFLACQWGAQESLRLGVLRGFDSQFLRRHLHQWLHWH